MFTLKFGLFDTLVWLVFMVPMAYMRFWGLFLIPPLVGLKWYLAGNGFIYPCVITAIAQTLVVYVLMVGYELLSKKFRYRARR